MSQQNEQRKHRRLSELAVRRATVTFWSAFGWIALSAAAYAGNALHVPLFFHAEILFGSIFTLIVLHYYGWVPALITSAVAASFTAILWLHPYAAVVLVLETLFVGLLYRRRSQNLMLLATLFWIPVGMPLVLFFYSGVMQIGLSAAIIVMLQQAINGIFNALIASLIIGGLKSFWPGLEPAESRMPFAFAEVIFLMVVAFVLIPAMGILIVSARTEMYRVEEEIHARLSLTSASTKQGVSAWMSENLHTLGSLATYARPQDSEQMRELRQEIALLKMSDEDFSAISVLDSVGRVVAAEPMEVARHALSGADVSSWPYFVRMANGMHGVASNAVARPGSGAPMVLLGVPIVHGDSFAGAVVGVLDVDKLRDVLQRLTGSWQVSATIVDGNGLALASTASDLTRFSEAHNHLPLPEEHLWSNLFVRFPPEDEYDSTLRRWQEAQFITLDRMGVNSDWLLLLDAPTAPYQEALTLRYQSTLFWMMVIIIAVTGLAALISRAMLGALTRLTVAAENLPDKVTAAQELDWPSSRIGEIDTLIHCFRITSDHLGSSFQQIQEAKRQAEAASHTKSQFLANVSHDLRTPLNGILGYAQILSHDSSLDERTQEAIRIIERSGNHLLNLINDILDISRIEAQRLELSENSFALRNFLEDLADIVRLQVRRKGLSLHTQFDPDLPTAVTGDEKRVRQILLNLLNNAVKFTSQGEVTFRARWQSGLFSAEVEDTGMGIPADEQEAVFSPFRQLSKHVQSEEGTGLGLSIVARLLEAMGGSVTLESTPGVGSLFRVTIPLAATHDCPVPVRNARSISGYEGARVSVLVVDDKWENRSVLRSMLEPLGFRVLEAENGAEGLSCIREERPQMVFMDLVMPVLDGFGAIKNIRAQRSAQKPAVVAVSASVANTIRQECVRVGFDDFLAKPFEEHQLLALIHRHTRVTWTYRDNGEEQRSGPETGGVVTVPAADELQQLAGLVSTGHVRQILNAADRLERNDSRLQPFADHVRKLAQEFQINQLADYLTHLARGTVEQDAGDE